jgi:hypothetical protein
MPEFGCTSCSVVFHDEADTGSRTVLVNYESRGVGVLLDAMGDSHPVLVQDKDNVGCPGSELYST